MLKSKIIMFNEPYMDFILSLNATLHCFYFTIVSPAAAAVRAGEGGSVCWFEEALPSQGHRSVPC